MRLFERSGAVEHDARTHPVARHLRPAEDARGVAQADFVAQPGAHSLEGGDLLLGPRAVQLVGAGEVAHQHHLGHVRASLQAFVGGAIFLREEADSVHAGVHLQPDSQRIARARTLDGVQLPGGMHDAPEILGIDQLQLALFEEAFQQQDRRTDAGLAQFQRLFDAGNGETVGFRFQSLGATHGAVAVGIRLDHRQGASAADFAGQTVVVAQGIEIDQGTGGTHGEDSLVIV
ncbi:hypothetical protein D3C76_786140 [compost metagenome]